MADKYYSTALGADLAENVTKGNAATPAAFVDVRITYDATGANRLEAAKSLDAIRNYILQDSFPPA